MSPQLPSIVAILAFALIGSLKFAPSARGEPREPREMAGAARRVGPRSCGGPIRDRMQRGRSGSRARAGGAIRTGTPGTITGTLATGRALGHSATVLGRSREVAPFRALLQRGTLRDLAPSRFHQAFDSQLSVYRVRIGSGRGRIAEGIFIPREGARAVGLDVDAHLVAYDASQLLGMEIVPPAAVRSGVRWTTEYGREGTGDGIVILKPADEAGLWGYHGRFEAPREFELFHSDVRILDGLLNEVRTNPGSLMMGTHWKTGVHAPYAIGYEGGDRMGTQGLTLALRTDSSLRGPLETVRRSTLAALRTLDARAVAARLGRRLGPEEQRALLTRRDTIVSHFDALIRERGEAAVVFDVPAGSALP